MEKKTFGLSIQKRKPVEVDQYKVRKGTTVKNIISAKLIGFTQAAIEDGTIYNVTPKSQSIVGLKKYFRIAYGAFIVEKPLERAKKDLPNCFRYRKGAMVKGYIAISVGVVDTFYITEYLNL